LLKLLLQWLRRGKRKGLIKPSNSPFKSPRKLKTHRIVLWRLQASPPRWQKAGQTERANRAFQLALQAAQKIESASDRSLALKEIAEAMAKAEQFDRALQIAQKIEDASDRSLALWGIAIAMAKVGQIDRAVEVAEMISDPIERLQTLFDIIAAKQKAGKGEAGKE